MNFWMRIERSENHILPCLRAILAALPQAIDEVAVLIRNDAAARARFDTGSLRASFYVMDDVQNSYGIHAASAAALNDRAVIVQMAETPAQYEAVIASAVEHFQFNEYGTAYMAAAPMLGPAMKAHEGDVADHVAVATNQAISVSSIRG